MQDQRLSSPIMIDSPSFDDHTLSPLQSSPSILKSSSSANRASRSSSPNAQKSHWSTRIFDWYCSMLDRRRWWIIILWTCMVAVCAYFAPHFLTATSGNTDPPAGSVSATANAVYKSNFPVAQRTKSMFFLVQRTVPLGYVPQKGDTANVLGPVTEAFTAQVNAAASAYVSTPRGVFVNIGGYYIYARTNYSALAGSFLSADSMATTISISYDTFDGTVASADAVGSFVSFLRGIQIAYPAGTTEQVKAQYTIGATGIDLLNADTIDGAEHDFVTLDASILPLALLVLALYMRNVRFILLPLISVGSTLGVSFAVMYPIATFLLDTAPYAPSIMVSCAIALSIDYSLFLLTRYREEKIKGALNHWTAIVKARAKRKAASLAGTKPSSSSDGFVSVAADAVSAVQSAEASANESSLDSMRLRRENLLSIKGMLRSSGHVVFVSGITLTLTFLSLTFFPTPYLQSIGIGAGLSLLTCIATNLVLVPVLLLAFPGFFGSFTLLPQCARKRLGDKWLLRIEGEENLRFQAIVARNEKYEAAMKHSAGADDGLDRASEAEDAGFASSKGYAAVMIDGVSTAALKPSSSDADSDEAVPLSVSLLDDRLSTRLAAQRRNRWFRLAMFSTSTRNSVFMIFLTLGLTVPLCYYSLNLRTSSDMGLVFPRDASSFKTYQSLEAIFSPGQIDPFNIIVTTGMAEGLFTESFFAAQTELSNQLIAQGLIAAGSLNSIVWFGGSALSLQQSLALLDPSSPAYGSESGYLYRTVVEQLSNDDRSAASMTLNVDFDPNGGDAPDWIDSTRAILATFDARATPSGAGKKLQYYLTGGGCDDVDTSRNVKHLFPTLIGMTLVAVFIISALLFRSLLAPVRLILTIGLSITWVYGLAVVTFQYGLFNWVDQDVLGSGSHTIFWLETIMSFSILVGLGLDYDVFLFLRVREYRMLGYSNRAAIVKATTQTGGIITIAGTVMAMAFGGLMTSKTMVLEQFGLILCFAVLFDTFIVRTLLVPALLNLFGVANWWPGAVPDETLTVDDFVETEELDERKDAEKYDDDDDDDDDHDGKADADGVRPRAATLSYDSTDFVAQSSA